MDRLFDRLEDQFGRTNVFRDIDSIGPGRNFSDVIIDSLKEVDVVIAAIGATWNEGRRLTDPSDFVRMEVSHALSRGTPIIPVLLDDTDLPTADELPADLQGLLSLNVSRVRRGADFRRDISKVVTAAQELASVERGRRAIAAVEEAAEQERARQEMESNRQREQRAAMERAEREAVETKRTAIQLAQEELRVRAALRELETEYAARRMSAGARVEGLETERRHAEAAAQAAADRLARLRGATRLGRQPVVRFRAIDRRDPAIGAAVGGDSAARRRRSGRRDDGRRRLRRGHPPRPHQRRSVQQPGAGP